MSRSIDILPYNSSHEAGVFSLIRLNTPAAFAPSEEKDFITYLHDLREQYFVIVQGDDIIGCGGINTADGGSTGVISWDMIHPAYHGQGLGGRLLRHRLEILQRMPDIRQIIVRTSQFAHAFYGKHGFELISIHPDYWAEGYDMYYMRLTL